MLQWIYRPEPCSISFATTAVLPHVIFFQSNGEFMRFSNYVREKFDLLMINSNKTANMRRYPSTD